MKKLPKLDIEKIKEKTSRTSLTIELSIFVFLTLLVVVALTAVGLWILSKAGVLLDIYGELKLGTVIFFMFLISLIIGCVMAFLGSKMSLKQVNVLINKMNRLASGDFKTRISFSGAIAKHQAFKEISDSFNTMAEELENTELLRSDFINNFSHEFKTPIVSITGFANLLEEGNLTEEQKLLYVRSIREESMRLSSMATNILNLTSVEKKKILTDVSCFNLSEQIRSAVLLLENKWVKKKIELQLDFDEYMIEANEEQLKQVWINLIDNAVKFASQNGILGLKIIEKDKYFYVKVSNTGSEIPYDKQEKIFTKFYQADESHATQGNGIGLAVVKHITELHFGEVTVKSENGVTEFTVMLPKKQL